MKKGKIIIANWKMNFLLKNGKQFVKKILINKKIFKNKLIICPPTSIIYEISKQLKNNSIGLGAQDCHFEKFGAFTGNVSPLMLKDIGCKYVILGHSERRIYHFESNLIIKKKLLNAIEHNLKVILCIGEDSKTKKKNKTLDFLAKQIKETVPTKNLANKIIIAYEPIWSIGSGVTPNINDISNIHKFIKDKLIKINRFYRNTKILYGGSVNNKNAKKFLKINEIDGLLVGGASTKLNKLISILSI